MNYLTFRQFASIGFILCVCLMAAALFFQYAMDLEPCPLCVLQRIAVIALGAVLLLAAVHNPKAFIARIVYTVLATLSALSGVFVAGRHVWLQNLPEDQVPACGPGYDYIMDAFPVFDGIKMILSGSGECADISWQFLGLSMPAWTLISFMIAVLACLYVLWLQVKLK